MKPALSEKERAALMLLGNKKPEQCDPFDSHIKGEIGRLSLAIGEGNAKVSELKAAVEETEQDLVRNIGAYQATARTYLAYIESSMIRPVPTPTDSPIPESPQEATDEPTPESGPPTPAEPETAKEDPKEEQDKAPEPESESAPESEPETDSSTDPEKG